MSSMAQPMWEMPRSILVMTIRHLQPEQHDAHPSALDLKFEFHHSDAEERDKPLSNSLKHHLKKKTKT
jgi:hypothetical protein